MTSNFVSDADKRGIEVRTPIRSVGDHAVHVRLHEDVVASLEVNVVPAKG